MKDKIFKIVKASLFMLPLIFIGSKVLYAQLNENAIDSWSGTRNEIVEKRGNTNDALTDNDLINGYYYYFDFLNRDNTVNYYNAFRILDLELHCSSFYVDSSAVDDSWFDEYGFAESLPSYSLDYVHIYINDNIYVYSHYSNFYYGYSFTLIDFGNSYFILQYDSSHISVDYNSSYRICDFLKPCPIEYLPVIYDEIIVDESLDNAFEYGLSEFNKIGFGKINFLEWFNDLFLNNNFNNVYSTFINSYLNYFLFVELVMFIPSVFHWVIHFFTEIGNNALTRSTHKKKGDE